MDGVGFAEGAQFVEHLHRRDPGEAQLGLVGDRGGKSRALEEAGAVAQVGEGGDSGVHGAGEGVLGVQKGGAEFGEGAEDGHGGEEQAAGFEGFAQLDEGAGEVVDPVQATMGDDEVKFLRAEGQGFAGDGDGQAAGEGRHFGGKIGGNDGHPARFQRGGDGAAAAEVEGG